MTRWISIAAVLGVFVGGLAAQSPQPTAPAGGAVQGRGAGPGQGRGGVAPGRGPVRDGQQAQTGTAVIRGRIVSAETGTPVRRAQVQATSVTARGTNLVRTDADGRFEFRGLTAGRWNITASKAGFVTLRYGQRRPFEGGTPIELTEGQVVERADLVLPRGAAITGRVFDEFGDPIAGARVQALRYQLVQGTRQLTPTGVTSQSDDTGAFRLFGLMPGDYYVSAVLRATPVDNQDDMTFAPTYYPGTASMSAAQRIPLSLAEETSISFGLLTVRTATLSGRVIDSTGSPLVNAMVALSSNEPGGVTGPGVGNGARVRADGTFSIPNVPPGSYTATATSGGGGRGGNANAAVERGSAAVALSGDDVAGLTIITSRGGSLNGTVTVASGSTNRTMPSGLQVTTQSLPGEGGGNVARPARINAEGAFQLTNLFGPRLIRVTGLPQGWVLDAVLAGGRDITDTPIDFAGSDAAREVQVVISDRVTALSGTVSAANGQLTTDSSVIVFPEDETMWRFPTRFIWSTRPDTQGLFKFRGLPPSQRYLAVAVEYLEDGEAGDPAFLAQMKARGTRFSLSAGEAKTIDLRVIAR